MTPGPEPSLCPGCTEIEDECVCWEEEQDAWDPRLLAAFTRHQPPLDLNGLTTLTEFGEGGCLVEVIDAGGWISLRVYFDEEEGEVYRVPPHVECAEDMAELIRDSESELTVWPCSGAMSDPGLSVPRRFGWCGG